MQAQSGKELWMNCELAHTKDGSEKRQKTAALHDAGATKQAPLVDRDWNEA
jgi:hypothetical protein